MGLLTVIIYFISELNIWFNNWHFQEKPLSGKACDKEEILKDDPVGLCIIRGLQAREPGLRTETDELSISPSANAVSELGALASGPACVPCVLILLFSYQSSFVSLCWGSGAAHPVA